LTGENIDEFDEFLSIRQHFPHQNFSLIIFCRLHIRPLFAQGVIASYIIAIRAHAILFPIYANSYEKTVVYIAIRTTARIPNNKVASYIASN